MHEQYILQPNESSPGTRNISTPPEAQNGSEEWLTLELLAVWSLRTGQLMSPPPPPNKPIGF